MVYVEGVEDVPFWEFLFSKLSNKRVKVEDVGGKPELSKYVQKVVSDEINAIIGMDSDFDCLVENKHTHSNIIRTFGHSIENSLICKNTIKKAISTIGRANAQELALADIDGWFTEVDTKLKDLVLYDIANEMNSLGHKVMFDNAERFLQKNTAYFCENKISEHLQSFSEHITNEMISPLTVQLEKVNRNTFNLIRGHFLFSAALKFVSLFINQLRKASISYEAFSAVLLVSLELIFNESHPHYSYYKSAFDQLK